MTAMLLNHSSFRNRHQQTPKLSALFTITLPRGPVDTQLRLSSYAGGCPALELLDADGEAFYSPTIAVQRQGIVELLPPELADTTIVAIKPSALRNGIANVLVDAGVLVDLEVEMPADRTWARLMQVADHVFAEPEPETATANADLALAPLPIPPEWERASRRIRHAFARSGFAISDQDAMLAWACHSRAIQRQPPALPPSGEEIVARLRGYFAER